MKLRWLLLYGALVILLSMVAVTFFSVYLTMQGINIPWVKAVPTGYAVNNTVTALIGLALGTLWTLVTHLLASRTGSHAFYYAGIPPIIIVVALTVLLLYGGACGVCRAVACSQVSSCGIRVQLSLTFFELYCNCAQALPSFLANLI